MCLIFFVVFDVDIFLLKTSMFFMNDAASLNMATTYQDAKMFEEIDFRTPGMSNSEYYHLEFI